tara:strand:+ start:232 stop:996 length:765 start_codon:yes stop_codon:yes gene_type:complete
MRRLLLATLALASAVPTAHASNEWFEPGTAVLITVSHGFEDMFRNWWHWYAKLDLNMEVLLLAEDEPTRSAFAESRNWTVITTTMGALPTKDHTYETPIYKKLVSRRPHNILRGLDKYPRLIYTDVDTVWLSDPRPHFAAGAYDFWGQLDDGTLQSPYYCTGFLAFKNTAPTRALLSKWAVALDAKPNLNQPLFNDLKKREPAKHCPLSPALFPSGRRYFDEKKRDGVVVVHNNFVIGKAKKIARFKQVGLWAV